MKLQSKKSYGAFTEEEFNLYKVLSKARKVLIPGYVVMEKVLGKLGYDLYSHIEYSYETLLLKDPQRFKEELKLLTDTTESTLVRSDWDNKFKKTTTDKEIEVYESLIEVENILRYNIVSIKDVLKKYPEVFNFLQLLEKINLEYKSNS